MLAFVLGGVFFTIAVFALLLKAIVRSTKENERYVHAMSGRDSSVVLNS